LAGDLDKLKFLWKKMKCPLNKDDIMVSAAEGGCVPLLKFLVKERCVMEYGTFISAAGAGCVPALEYAMTQVVVDDWAEWLEEAAMNGHLHVLQWAADQDEEWTIEWNDRTVCCSAAQSGSIEMMLFLQQRGANLAEHSVTSEESWAEDSITTAAARGERKEMLLWLKQQGILPTVHAMREAAQLDMLDMCLWLHAEGCPWDASVLNSAARDGDFELVQALHERGCPIDVYALCMHAARHGRVDVLQYLLQLPHQPQWTAQQLTALLNIAGEHEQLAVAKWLRQQGAEWPAVLGTATYRKWKGKLLQWARRAGCTSALPAEPLYEDDSDSDEFEEE
jgi:Ankyrin repeats (3 copies)